MKRRGSTTSLGDFVDGVEGTIRPPPPFVRRLRHFTVSSLIEGSRSPGLIHKWLQILAGRWVRCCMFRREGMPCLDCLWRCIAQWKGQRCLPSTVADELLTCLCLLPLFRTDLRLTASGIVTASDV